MHQEDQFKTEAVKAILVNALATKVTHWLLQRKCICNKQAKIVLQEVKNNLTDLPAVQRTSSSQKRSNLHAVQL
jgi:translation initiation factor IF-3